jgi:hypothetical protein
MSVLRIVVRGVLSLGFTAGSLSSAFSQIQIRFEAPGVQSTSTSGASVASFDGLTVGNSYSSIPLPAGSGGPSGNFTTSASTTWVRAADQFGGAGGTGNYVVAGAGGPGSFTLTLSNTSSYLGFWLSGMDNSNQVEFFKSGNSVGIFNAAQVTDSGLLQNSVWDSITQTGHKGNPNSVSPATVQNSTEYYAFINFYAEDTAHQFDTVVFTQLGGGGLEIDNISLFSNLIDSSNRTGTIIGNVPAPVPEPMGMLAAGMGVLAAGAWLRRRVVRV